jgi:hypothetical protein
VVRPEEMHRKTIDQQSKKFPFALIYRSDQIPVTGSNSRRVRGGVTQSCHLSLIYRGTIDEVRNSGEEESCWA